jgi:hypothetical protein
MADTILDSGSAGDNNTPSGEGNTPTDFISSLPEEYRSDPALQSFKDQGSLVKSYLETKKLVGNAAVIKPPSDPAALEQWKKDMKPKLTEMGLLEAIPESPDKYEFTFKDAEGKDFTPEQIKGDPALKEYAAIAHEMGLSNKQAQALAEQFASRIMPSMFPPQPSKEEVTASLTKELGPKFTQKIDIAKKAVNVLNGKVPGFKDWLDNPARGTLGNDPVYIKVMATIGEMLGQDFSGPVGEKSTETLQTIEDKIRAIRADTGLTPEQQNQKFMPLYQLKAKLLKAQKLQG